MHGVYTLCWRLQDALRIRVPSGLLAYISTVGNEEIRQSECSLCGQVDVCLIFAHIHPKGQLWLRLKLHTFMHHQPPKKSIILWFVSLHFFPESKKKKKKVRALAWSLYSSKVKLLIKNLSTEMQHMLFSAPDMWILYLYHTVYMCSVGLCAYHLFNNENKMFSCLSSNICAPNIYWFFSSLKLLPALFEELQHSREWKQTEKTGGQTIQPKQRKKTNFVVKTRQMASVKPTKSDRCQSENSKSRRWMFFV